MYKSSFLKYFSTLILFLVVISSIFISCKKENNNQNQVSITGIWNLKKCNYLIIDSNYTPPTITNIDTIFSAGEYFNFQNNGKLISYHNNIYDTLIYAVNGTQIQIIKDRNGNSTYYDTAYVDILKLDNDSFVYKDRRILNFNQGIYSGDVITRFSR